MGIPQEKQDFEITRKGARQCDLERPAPFTKADCCPLPTVTYGGAGIKPTAGTQYWVLAVTNSASITTEDIWCLVWNDAIGTFAYDRGNGWKLEADRDSGNRFRCAWHHTLNSASLEAARGGCAAKDLSKIRTRYAARLAFRPCGNAT